MKLCIKCNIYKDIFDFSPKHTAKDGLHPYCKKCKALSQKETRLRNPDYSKEYYRKNSIKKISNVRILRAIKQGRLDHPTTLICSMEGCKNKADHYHHLTYDRVAKISPVCKLCHAQIHSGDSSEKDLNVVITLEMSNTGKVPKHSSI